jgi:hypothetical protein
MTDFFNEEFLKLESLACYMLMFNYSFTEKKVYERQGGPLREQNSVEQSGIKKLCEAENSISTEGIS